MGEISRVRAQAAQSIYQRPSTTGNLRKAQSKMPNACDYLRKYETAVASPYDYVGQRVSPKTQPNYGLNLLSHKTE